MKLLYLYTYNINNFMLISMSFYWPVIIGFVLIIFVILFVSNKKLRSYKRKNEKSITDGKLRYKELADLLPQMVVELDNEGRFSFINKLGLDFIGYSKFEIDRMTIFSIIHPDDMETFRQEYLYLLEGGENKGQEFRVVTKHKKTFFMVFYLKRKTTTIEQGEGLRGFIIDISERIKLERKVLSTILETEDKERRRFSEDLHDGLGPLLSTIKLYVNQMDSSIDTDSEQKEMFAYTNEMLDDAISSTRNIANNILPGSIVDNGLEAAVRSFVKHIKQAGGINISFKDNITHRFDIKIEINFYRIIIELVNNSIKYANASKLEINLQEEGNQLKLHFHDDGKGFEIDKVKQGLGHTNIKNRAQSLNGEFEYLSELNRGMSFDLVVEATPKELID